MLGFSRVKPILTCRLGPPAPPLPRQTLCLDFLRDLADGQHMVRCAEPGSSSQEGARASTTFELKQHEIPKQLLNLHIINEKHPNNRSIPNNPKISNKHKHRSRLNCIKNKKHKEQRENHTTSCAPTTQNPEQPETPNDPKPQQGTGRCPKLPSSLCVSDVWDVQLCRRRS